MEQHSSGEASNCPVTQEIHRILLKCVVHYHIYNIMPGSYPQTDKSIPNPVALFL